MRDTQTAPDNSDSTAAPPASAVPPSDADLRLIGRGGALVFAGALANRALTYAAAMVIGRGLGAAVFGDYGLVMSLERFSRVFANAGLQQANLKFVSASLAVGDRGGARAVACVTGSISLLLSGLLFAALWGLAPLLATNVYGRPELITPFRIASAAIPLASLMMTLLSVAQAARDIVPLVVINRVGVPLLFLAGAAVIVAREGTLTGLMWAWLGATCLGLIAAAAVALTWLRRHRGPRSAVSLREVAGFAAIICVSTSTNMILSAADVLILARYVSAEHLGIYVAASRTARFIALPLSATNPLLTPVASQLWERREIDALRRVYRIATRWATGGAFAVVAPMMIAPALLMGLFGAQFTAGALVLIAVGLGELVNVATGGVAVMLNMTGGQRVVAVTNAVAAVVVIGALLVISPAFGALGVAVCMGAGRAAVNLARLWWLWHTRLIHPYDRRFALCALASAALIAAAMLLAAPGALRTAAALAGFYACFAPLAYSGWLGAERRVLRAFSDSDPARARGG